MKLIYLAAILMATIVVNATDQQKGKIVYEQTINIHKSLSPDQQALKAIVPEKITKNYELYFTPEKARLKEIEQVSNTMMIRMGGDSSGNIFFDLKDKKLNSFFSVDGEHFYTESEIEPISVASNGKSKEILGYKCKAFVHDKKTFWVTQQLPKYLSPLSPFHFNGTVLAIDSDKISYKANKIEKEINPEAFSTPEAQRVTKEQAEDLQEEAINSMKQKIKK